MRSNVRIGAACWMLLAASFAFLDSAAAAPDLLEPAGVDQLAARRFWQTGAPVPSDDCVVRTVLLDDNLYLLTQKNLAYAIHAKTGVIRWTALVAEPDQSLRGPTHSAQYVFFTAPASVKVLDRATGELAAEPRELRGVLFDLNHDIATVSIGQANGIRVDDVLDVYRSIEDVGQADRVVAQLRITVVESRHSKGEIIRASRTVKVEPGMRVAADVRLPIRNVKLPFAAASPAVADRHNIYIGSANQRFASLDILGGYRNWETTVPKNVTTTPILLGEELYFASGEGRVTASQLGSSQHDEARLRWEFDTEGPVFHEMAIDAERLYVPSNDRILYALDRKTGRRVWTERFEHPPSAAPRLSDNRLYHRVTGEGLYVLDARTGKRLWKLDEQGQFLAHFGNDAYIYTNTDCPYVLRLDASTGREKARVAALCAEFVQASPVDQLILLADARGTVMCIRPKSAPPLMPQELASVLQNDARAKELARMTAEQRARAEARVAEEEPKRPDISFIDEDDLLGSRSTARPAGGRGLVEVEEGGTAKDAPKPAEDDTESAADEDSTDEEAPAEEDAEAEEGAEAEDPSDEDSSDEESTDEEPTDEEPTDEDEDEDTGGG